VNQILIYLICFCLLFGGWLLIDPKKSRYAFFAFGLLSLFVFLYAYSIKGVMFQFAVLAVMLPLFACIFRLPRNQWVPFACTGMLALIVWTVIKPAPYHNYVERTIKEAGEEGLEWRRNGPSLVYEAIQNDWNGSGSPSIWCSAFGWVDAKTISWEAIKKGHPWYVETLAGSYAENSKTIVPGIIPENADYLVMPSLGITGEIKMPSTCFDMNPAARSNNRFQLRSEIKAPQGFIGIYKKNRTPL
jgi:hypothetical protein